MGLFIEATTEPFTEVRGSLAEEERENSSTNAAGAMGVRRPVRGVQLKENSYAVIRIIGPNGRFMNVIDAAGETFSEEDGVRKTHRYSNFFVGQVMEERMEKQQIVDNFGDPIIFLFGEAPRIVQVQGHLLNTADFNWREEFWYNYDRYFRGTRLVEMNARLYLIYDDRIIEGLMIRARAQQNQQTRGILPFGFHIFVTGTAPIHLVGDPNYPRPEGDIDFTEVSSYERGLQAWESSRNLQQNIVTNQLLSAGSTAIPSGFSNLSNMLREGVVHAGSPSITAFLQRAAVAAGTSAIADVISARGGTGAEMAKEGKIRREIPLREEFIDNVDEFIGGVPQRISRELAESLSIPAYWTQADQQIDQTIISLVNTAASQLPAPGGVVPPQFDPSEVPYYDLMGRAGRADQEIRAVGGQRRRLQTRQSSVRPEGRGELLRDVPFGLINTPGDLPSL